MAPALLTVENLNKSFGGIAATDHVDLIVEAGEIHAVIGPNGAGKTTLVAQLSGELRPDGGEIKFVGKNITPLAAHARAHLGIARTFQITNLMLDMTVRDRAALGGAHAQPACPLPPVLGRQVGCSARGSSTSASVPARNAVPTTILNLFVGCCGNGSAKLGKPCMRRLSPRQKAKDAKLEDEFHSPCRSCTGPWDGLFLRPPDDGGFWSRWVVFARGTVLVVSGQSARIPSIGPPRFYRPGVGGRRAAT